MIPLLLFLASTFSTRPLVVAPATTCHLETRADIHSPGRFIWKPSGAHFGNAVIVIPRYFGTSAVASITIYANGDNAYLNRPIDRPRLKSKGDCPGLSECLFAQTFLAGHSGKIFRQKYRSLLVQVRVKGKECREYRIDNPSRRAEYRG